MTDQESLLEALSTLERAREDERALRIQAECVSEALWLLTERGSFEHTRTKIVDAFRKAFQAEEAFIISFAEGHPGRVVATTTPRFSSAQWQIGPTFRRAIEAQPIASFDITQLAEWRDQPEPIKSQVGSALHISLKSGEPPMMVVLTHSARAFFNRTHVSLGRRLARRAAQALARAQAEETEDRLQRETEQINQQLLHEVSQRLRIERELEQARELVHKKELEEKLELIEHQRAAIRALSTPIMQVWPGILCLPVIGFVDEHRSADITSALLDAVLETGATEVVIDVTGIAMVDANTAGHFFRMARAVQLLGARSALTGVTPEVARTLIGLGRDAMGDAMGITAYRSLRDALQHFITQSRERRTS